MENATGKWRKWVKYVWNRTQTRGRRKQRERERERRTGKFFVWLPRDSFKKICQPFSTDKSGQHVIAVWEKEGNEEGKGEGGERLMQFAAEHEKGCVPATLTHCTGVHRTWMAAPASAPAPAPAPVGVESASLCLRCLECESSISAICHINTNQHTNTDTHTCKQKHMSIHISLRICLCEVWHSCNACPLSCSWMRWHLALANCQLPTSSCHLPLATCCRAQKQLHTNCWASHSSNSRIKGHSDSEREGMSRSTSALQVFIAKCNCVICNPRRVTTMRRWGPVRWQLQVDETYLPQNVAPSATAI